jgi:hypothetical protein
MFMLKRPTNRCICSAVLFVAIGILFAACPAYCSTYYVDPNGNDSNSGDINHPFKTITHAADLVVGGDTIYVLAGTFTYTGSSTAITLDAKSGASASNRCYLMGYNDERPLLDFSAMTGTSAEGLAITGSYWYVKGIDCKGAPHNGIRISGTYNIVEFCSSYENRNTGVGVAGGAAYNQIINCDSYYNCDSSQGNADGFAPKIDVGTGNYFYGCRSWQNSDDAYDGYLRPATGGPNSVNTTYENCWAMKAGYLKSGAVATSGNGNGFKMGGGDNSNAAKLRHNVTLINCLAFNNSAKGFDQNNDKGDMTLYNCTAFDNGTGIGGANYSISVVLAGGATAKITNCVYLTGTMNLETWVVQTTNSWLSPFTTTSADFVNIDPSACYGARKADGSLPDITFMHLAAGSDLIDGGTDVNLPHNGSAPDLGCFETGGTSLPGQASSPVPSNGATNVSLTQDLSWTAGLGATSHDVYFGTTSPGTLQGNQTGTTFDTGTMTQGLTYYWRIDEVNEVGTTIGTVWSFTTVPPPPPGAASNPTPADGATGVSQTQDLSWTAGSGTTSHDVYFGTSSPGTFRGTQTGTTYDTGAIAATTTYYWRIDEKNAGGTTTGTVWSFTTQDDTMTPTPDPMTWASVPTATGSTSITMTAATAADNSLPVQYYFECTTDSGKSSGWQTSTTYVASGLTPTTLYSFRVKARDSAPALNETDWSSTQSATTQAQPSNIELLGSWVSGTTHAKETGNNRALIFIAHGELSSGTMNLSSVTYGGQSMTKVVEYNYNAASGYAYAAAFILKEAGVAAASTSTFTPTWSGTQPTSSGYSSAFFSNVNQTTSTGATGTGGSTTNPVTTSSSLATSSGDMVILGATCGNVGTYTLNNSFIEGTDQQMSSATGVTGRKLATGANETPSATYSSTINRQMIIGFVLKVAAGVSPPGQAGNPTPTNGATGVSITADLSWTAGSGATSRDVYFGTAASPPQVSTSQTATTFDTGTMASLTTYYWRINEKNASGTTTGAVWNFTTADTTPPEAPTGLTVILPGEANVPLDWNDNSEIDLAGYNIYRSETSGSGYSKLNGSLLTSSDYTDNITTHDTTYYYVVTAVDTSSNESDNSNEVFGGLYGDFTGNGLVEIADLADFLDYWLEDDCNETAGLDLDDNCIVNFYEFSVLADNWLQ